MEQNTKSLISQEIHNSISDNDSNFIDEKSIINQSDLDVCHHTINNSEELKSLDKSNNNNNTLNNSNINNSNLNKSKFQSLKIKNPLKALYLLHRKSLDLSSVLSEQLYKKKQFFIKNTMKNIKLGQISSILLNKKKEDESRYYSISRRQNQLQKFYHMQYLFNCKLQLIFSILSICLSIVEYECTVIESNTITHHYIHTHKNKEKIVKEHNINENLYDASHKVALLCSIFCFVTSILLWITILFDFALFNQVVSGNKIKNFKFILEDNDELLNFIFNIVIFLPTPNPFSYGIEVKLYNDKTNITYYVPLNAIFTSFLLFRFWFLFKYFLVTSNTYNQRSFRICKMNGVKISLGFPFKSNMVLNPLIVDALLFVLLLFVCSYDIRIFERYLDEVVLYKMGNFNNDLWCIFLSMTTVGYGDITPNTEFGRLFTIVGCLFGSFLVSMVFVSVSSYLNITGTELNAYKILEKSYLIEERKKKAIKAVLNYFKSRKSLRKLNKKEIEKNGQKYAKAVGKSLEDFKKIDNVFMKTFTIVNEYDNILEHLRFLEDNVNRGQKKVDKINELLNKLNACFNKPLEQKKNKFNSDDKVDEYLTNKNVVINKGKKEDEKNNEEEERDEEEEEENLE